ncbi:diaminobutyrate acetyltransferase [Teredinibacter waterburyi]|jgi:L-2,4-diaminobutyric acid acetyltransferase|uniref:diaminobutyrate acetyltransferase n=1 Tax=Teredinibacter waterburyi TaxID=1500538 RepID=UPI00165EE0A9|nr:diaminobutyrate acetyltransferase [Teredinibacter waterburyi]
MEMRNPAADDGPKLTELVRLCPPLDANSRYCNLLQCSHFSATSIVALVGERLVGAITGYIIPQSAIGSQAVTAAPAKAEEETLFVWQVAVAAEARGEGLASRMLQRLIQMPACKNVAYIETTITEDNQASWALFRRFSEQHSITLTSAPLFDSEIHFEGEHATEHCVRLGPLSSVN